MIRNENLTKEYGKCGGRGGWGRGGGAEAFSGKEGLNRWWLLRLTVKIFAILRLTVTIIPSLSPQIFFTVNIFYDYRLKFINSYA